MAKKRKCLTCEHEYEYCPKCGNSKDYPAWKTEFCEESCKEIFNAVSGYNMNLITADDVKKVLKKYNITDFNKYKKSIKDKLIEITSTATPEVEEVKTEEIKVETEQPKVEEVKPETKAEVKPVFKSENKYDKKKFDK